jgi:hypothetical protein
VCRSHRRQAHAGEFRALRDRDQANSPRRNHLPEDDACSTIFVYEDKNPFSLKRPTVQYGLIVILWMIGTYSEHLFLTPRQPTGDHDRFDRLDPRERGATSSNHFVAYCLRPGSHDTVCGSPLSIGGTRGLRCHSIDGSHGGNGRRPVADFDCLGCCGPALAVGHSPGVHLAGRWPSAKLGWQLEKRK